MSDNEASLRDRLQEVVLKTAPKDVATAVLDDEVIVQGLIAVRRFEPIQWGQCVALLPRGGGKGVIVKSIEDAVRKQVDIDKAKAFHKNGHNRVMVRSVWPDAPVDDQAFVPKEYKISAELPAIVRPTTRQAGGISVDIDLPVSPMPVVIKRWIANVNDHDFWLELAFRLRGRWRTLIVRSNIVADHRKIIELKARGLPVTSDNAFELVRYLSAYESEDEHVLETSLVTNATGWQGANCEYGFMCGLKQIKPETSVRDIDFHGGGEADEADLEGIHAQGSLGNWLDLISDIKKFPLMQLAIYASVAAPLLHVLECGNAFIEWAGRTSRGKTTALRLAQSCWRSGAEQFVSWNTTQNALEDRARRLNDLPLILDDTSSAHDHAGRSIIAKSIYSLIGGRARGRAARDGSERKRSAWRTIVLTTGEQPISSYAKAEGAAARCLSLLGNPLGDVSSENARLADAIRLRTGRNYGHAGPEVVRWLCANQDQWPTLRKDYDCHLELVRGRYEGPASSRIAEVVALLEVAASVLHQAIEMPWGYDGLCDSGIFAKILGESVEHVERSADRADEAWHYMLSVAAARPQAWRNSVGVRPLRGEHDAPDPPGGWLGSHDPYVNQPPRSYDPQPDVRELEYNWHPHALRKVLEEGGYEYDATLRAWRDASVAQPGSPHLPHLISDKGRFTRKVELDGAMSRVVTVKAYTVREDSEDVAQLSFQKPDPQ